MLTLLSVLATGMEAQTNVSLRFFSVRNGLAANQISGIDQAPNGLIWIATWNGLCCYDGYRFTTFRGSTWGEEDALSTNRIAMIHCTTLGDVWVRTFDAGLYLLDTHHGCHFVNVGQLLEKKYGTTIKARHFYGMPSGHTWITDEQGALNLRISDEHPTDVERMEVFGTKGKPLYGKYIKKVEADAKGREWLLTDLGMMCYNTGERESTTNDTPRSTALDTTHIRLLTSQGIPTENIEKHFTDQQKNLWFSTSKGLSLVNFQQQLIKYVPSSDRQQVRAILTLHDGRNISGNDMTSLMPPEAKESRIYALFEDSRGTLWIGTKGAGCWRKEKGGTTVAVPVNCPHIYDFDEDNDGNVWIATFGDGVYVAKDGKANVSRPDSYPKKGYEKVRRLTHDSKGNLYISTTTGLVTISGSETRSFHHEQNDTTSLMTSDVMQTLIAHDGTIYVVTLGGGVQRLVNGSKGFSTLVDAGQQSGNALSLAEDHQGRLWIIHEAGIECYIPDNRQLLQYAPHTNNNMPFEMTEAKPAIDSNGSIWLGVMDGLITFNPQEMQKSNYAPCIIFTEVQYQGDRVAHPILNMPTLIVGKHQRNMTISFAALDYKDNYLMQYAYRMDEGEWNYIGHNPRIAFSELSAGRHKLTVRSTNSDGVWVNNYTVLIIDVTPTFWEMTWVRILALLLIITCTTWGIIRYRQYRLQTREREQRMDNLMRQYRELQETINENENSKQQIPTHKTYHLEEPKIVNADEEMMNTLMLFIEQHISDSNLKIEDMAETVNMGRTVFYKKMTELVGMSPSEFLRSVRMQRARQLIAKSRMTFSEIAYNVGFTDPKYFSKCFKKDTGMTPSEYREKEID